MCYFKILHWQVNRHRTSGAAPSTQDRGVIKGVPRFRSISDYRTSPDTYWILAKLCRRSGEIRERGKKEKYTGVEMDGDKDLASFFFPPLYWYLKVKWVTHYPTIDSIGDCVKGET